MFNGLLPVFVVLITSDKDIEEDFAEFAKYFKATNKTQFDDMEEEEGNQQESSGEEEEKVKPESSAEEMSESGGSVEDESEEEEAMTLVDEFVQPQSDSKMEVVEPPQQESHKSASSEDACGW